MIILTVAGASDLSVQSLPATGALQDGIERSPLWHSRIFRAQHGERARMIFLRLLDPDLVTELDAELFLAFSKGFLVGERPWQEFLADLAFEDRQQRRLQRRPWLERTFAARPQHAVYPVEHMRRAAFD